MARPIRIEYENALYHILSRGNERKSIFKDNKDYEKFLYYISLMHQRYGVIIYCFVLMNNHYHLLLETPKPTLSRTMRDLNGHYTIYFNKCHKRDGHLFQGRYKAILVDKDSYLLELSRYIHLNPIRAKVVDKPEDYPYSSMPYYVYKTSPPSWLNTSFILEQFGDTIKIQRAEYKKFVYEGIKNASNPLSNIYANSMLGSETFIKEITDKFLRKRDIDNQIPNAKRLKYGKDLTDIAESVLKYYHIKKETLIRKNTRFNNAKKAFIYLTRKYTDASLKQIAHYLDDSVSDMAISQQFKRTQQKLLKLKEKNCSKEIKMIEEDIFC